MDDSASRTLWCGNLSWEIGDEVLFDLFLQAGPLEKVSIPKERDGRSKGYGFITFKHECSVPYAMELMNGTTLYGKMINLQHRTGAKVDTMPNDSRNSYHQRSMSLQEQGSMFGDSGPNIDQAQSFNNLCNMAAGILGSYPLISQMAQDWSRQSGNQNYQRNWSHNMGSRYHDGNNRDDRRGNYGNRNDRYQPRNNSYQGRARDNDYHHGYRSGNSRDRNRDRDRDRSRSNNRPSDNRYRSRQ